MTIPQTTIPTAGIAGSVRAQDRMQLEAKLEFRYEPASEPASPVPVSWWQRLLARLRPPHVHRYDVEMYFFLPYNLGLDSQTYPKNVFYGDVRTYVRVKRPDFTLLQLLTGPGSPMTRLADATEALADAPSEETARRFEHDARMFCSVAAKALFCHADHVLARPADAGAVPLAQALCEGARGIVQRYRTLGSRLLDPSVLQDTLATYRFGDEYLSLHVERVAYYILEGLRKSPETLSAVHASAIGLAHEEIEYRRAHGYASVTSRRSDTESTLFRADVLKRYIGNVLLLDTRLGREQQLVQQLLFGLAAGGAMLFATAVVFFFQLRYGALTVPFFAAAVISYMFKDRIKDLLRYYLTAQAGNWLFDRQTNVYSSSGERIGACLESVDFMPEGHVPEPIAHVRRKERLTEIENRLTGEKVIRYRKRISIVTDRFARAFPQAQVDGLTDVTHYSIEHMVRKMSDPRAIVFVANGHDAYDRIRGRRVYHVNLVLRYGRHGDTATFRRFRLILTRKGIRRIDEIATVQ